MNNLNVTDLQRIIRSYADAGHDITQSPQHVHIDDKKYGMTIGHHLAFGTDNSTLSTHLMQAERPLVSQVVTDSRNSVMPIGPDRKEGHYPLQRNVTALSRHMRVSDQQPPEHSYDSLQWLRHHLPEHDTGEWTGGHGEWRAGNGLWIPHGFTKYESSHEALQSHTSAEVPHAGVLHTRNSNNEGSDQFKSVRERFGPRPREMTPEEHSSFNNIEAFHDLVEVKPFAGLVHVESYDPKTRGKYTYNPQTEELHQHDH